MKKLFSITVLFFLIISFNSFAKNPSYYYDDYYYTSISPYGKWIELEPGFVVWQPLAMKRSWSPYSDGRWVWTRHGWYWDSYEPFGHVVYHYGRWHFDEYYGWIWVPGNEWAPAWVEWRYDDDYIGWAPLSPYANFSINIGIHYSHNYIIPAHHYHFVRYKHFCNPHLSGLYIGNNHKVKIFSKTKYRTNYKYRDGRVVNAGVDVNVIRKRGRIDIHERDIKIYRDKSYSRDDDDDDDDERPVRAFIASRDEISRNDIRSLASVEQGRNHSLKVDRIERDNLRKADNSENRSGRTINRSNQTDKREIIKNDAADAERKSNSRSSINEKTLPSKNESVKRLERNNNKNDNDSFRREGSSSKNRSYERKRSDETENENKRNDMKRNERKIESNERKEERSERNVIRNERRKEEKNNSGSRETLREERRR